MTLHTPPQNRCRGHSSDDATANQLGRWATNPVGITPGRFYGKRRGQFWSGPGSAPIRKVAPSA
jgi:hypothetical protein